MIDLKKGTAVAALISMVGISSAWAQGGPRDRGGDGWGPRSQYGRMYDTNTVETVSGRVMKVEKMAPLRGMASGVHLLVDTGRETLPVHLGPGWFLERQEAEFRPNDEIQVTGSRVTINGRPALIASQVRRDDEVLALRDAAGNPAWAGWRSAGRGGMMRQGMAERHREMMAEHQKMMSELKARDAELKEKVEAMNEAEGQEKVNAMSEVINELVEERQQMRDHMATMRQRMMSHMQQMQESMAEPESGRGGTGPSSQSENDK